MTVPKKNLKLLENKVKMKVICLKGSENRSKLNEILLKYEEFGRLLRIEPVPHCRPKIRNSDGSWATLSAKNEEFEDLMHGIQKLEEELDSELGCCTA